MATDKCDGCDKYVTLTTFCVEDTQCFCTGCTIAHTRQRATASHILIRVSQDDSDTSSSKIGKSCKICDSRKEVVNLCVICRELYCDECSKRHQRLNATKDHHLSSLILWNSDLVIKPTESFVSDNTNAQVEVQPQQYPNRHLYKGTLFTEKLSSAPGETEVTRIRGMTMLTDGRLIVIDSKNKCLKIFKPEWYDFVTKKDLGDEPRGIATVSQDEVVVTFDYKKEVTVYKIDKANNLWKQRSFGTREKPFSVSYSRKTFALEIGEGDDGKIAVTDFNGNVVYLIRGQNSRFGQFTGNTIRLAHDNERKVAYVVNVSDGFIHCVDYRGNVKWAIKINMPRGVALHENTLFIASKGDNKIYQINTEDGKIYDLLSFQDKIDQPRYIAFQPIKEKLVVEVGSNVNIYNVTKNR